MPSKNISAPEPLVAVVDALESLTDADRQWVLQSAASRWALVVQASSGGAGNANAAFGGGNTSSGGPSSGEAEAAVSRNDIRGFIRQKKPTTDVERVACLVYFLSKTTGQSGFNSQAIGSAHVESGGSAINMPRALDNATRRSKYLSNRGAREKQLTPLGEDVVEALPNREAVAAIEADARQRKIKKAPKKKKTKK